MTRSGEEALSRRPTKRATAAHGAVLRAVDNPKSGAIKSARHNFLGRDGALRRRRRVQRRNAQSVGASSCIRSAL
jgi:hypothetical protein